MSTENQTNINSETAPKLLDATCHVEIVGRDVGTISVECQVPPDYSKSDLREHFRLEIPGEMSLLSPVDLTGEHGHYSLTFFSADIANSGHLPKECTAVWEFEEGDQKILRTLSCKSTTQNSPEPEKKQETVTAKNPDWFEYPRTVGLVTIVTLALVGIVWMTYLLFSL